MGVTAELAALLRAGVRLDFTADPRGPIFRVRPPERPRLDALLAPTVKPVTQAALRHAAEYRRVLLDMFAMNAQGPDADLDAARQAVQEEMRLVDELGVPLADAVRAQVAPEYARATGLCPRCGSPEHDA